MNEEAHQGSGQDESLLNPNHDQKNGPEQGPDVCMSRECPTVNAHRTRMMGGLAVAVGEVVVRENVRNGIGRSELGGKRMVWGLLATGLGLH